MDYTYLQAQTAHGRMPSQFDRDEPPVHFVVVYTGEGSAEDAFMEHNRDDRPLGSQIRSMSVGDVVFEWDLDRVVVCAPFGWVELQGEAAQELRELAIRGRPAFGTLTRGAALKGYWEALRRR